MQDIQTVAEAFVGFMENEGLGTFGDTIFLTQVPDSAPDSVYWIITAGGNPISKNSSGESVRQYFLSVYYRSTSGKDVERSMYHLENLLNCTNCVQLEGYDVLEISSTLFPQDRDLDSIERRVGFLQANIKIYKKEC